MRTRINTQRSSGTSVQETEQPKFTPLLPILEAFAKQARASLSQDMTDRDWSVPQCILSGNTTHGTKYTFYITGGPGDMKVNALCWGSQGRLGQKSWVSFARNFENDLRSMLENALSWAEAQAQS